VKRARYAAELLVAAGGKGARGYVKRAKVVQDALGDHQDAVLAAAALEDLDRHLHRPAAHMAAAALADVQDARRRAARAAFPKAWKRLDRRARVVA
jgi:CHAD domain-containing protein